MSKRKQTCKELESILGKKCKKALWLGAALTTFNRHDISFPILYTKQKRLKYVYTQAEDVLK